MPSAARQRLPFDLCHQGYQKYSNCSPEFVYHIQEIQASPGHFDVFQVEKQQKHHGSRKHLMISPRKHTNFTAQVNPKSSPRRCSPDSLTTVQSDTERNTGGCRKVTLELSCSTKSNSCPNLNPIVTDAYAMDSTVAPHPSEVPFPPLEWLQFSSHHLVSPVANCRTFNAVLCCYAPA